MPDDAIRTRRRGPVEEPGIGGRERGEGLATALSAEDDQRLRRIQEAAYFRSARRGFAPGHELDDWLAAEQDIAPPHRKP